jgi:hypothetical protein
MSRKVLVILLVFGLLVGNVPLARGVEPYWFWSGSWTVLDWQYILPCWSMQSNVDLTAGFWCNASCNGYPIDTYQVYWSGTYFVCQMQEVTYPYPVESKILRNIDLVWVFSWGSDYGGGVGQSTMQGTSTWVTGTTYSPDADQGVHHEVEAPVVPLAVTIDSGPTSVDLVNGGTWHAAATGGATPYTYYWDWSPLGGAYHYNTPFDPLGPTGSDTYSHTWPTAGTYVLECMVQDADGTWADDTYQVSAASVIGSYHALFARYGDKGQYLNVQVDDAAGNPVTISSTAGTQYGLYEAGGAFGWFAADSEAAQLVTYTWRWVMGYTVTPPGLSLPPPADFWIETSIHLAVPNIDLQVTHHFTSLSETLDPWYGPEGDPQVPETPPSETSTLPDWLQPVYDMFVRLLRFLFVPSSSDFSAQLASGWLLIASPVPSITPQYTIPFPNPNHLLAPTGDSVNIDFSGIQAYSGYSTYKTIVQVVLDAILLFIVISLVT